MSPATHMDVSYVAKLARLELTPEETLQFQRQLDRILDYVAQLQSLNTASVEPTAHATPVFNGLRTDIPRPGLSQEEALRNAPVARRGQFIVPKIIE